MKILVLNCGSSSVKYKLIDTAGDVTMAEGGVEKIGLDGQHYSVHKLRHTAATLMYQHSGIDVLVLKDLLGHENLSTTEIYTHIENKQLRDAISKNPLSGESADKSSDNSNSD